MERTFKEVILPAIGLIALAAAAWVLIQLGMGWLQEMRQLERTPPSYVGAMLPGQVQTNGWVVADATLTSPLQGAKCVYYYYLHESVTYDSDGDASWHTESARREVVDFRLRDHTGEIPLSVVANQEDIDWDIANPVVESRDKHRYTEWCLRPEDKVFTFAFARAGTDGLWLDYTPAAGYSPIISTRGAEHHQGRFGTLAVLTLWAGLTVTALAVYCLALCLRIHQVWRYLTLLSSISFLLMLHFSLLMLKADLAGGTERVIEQLDYLESIVAGGGSEARTAEQLSLAKVTVAASRLRLEQQYARFPERRLVQWWDLELPDWTLALDRSELKQLDRQDLGIPETRLSGIWVAALILLGLLAAALLTWAGLRTVGRKRMIENIAAQKTLGVAVGLAETGGSVEPLAGEEPLRGPVSGAECCWYDYQVLERRGSGKKKRWVTVEQQRSDKSFLCVDDEGSLRIDPEGAEVIASHRVSRREGKRRYIENSLLTGGSLYALGPVNIAEDTRRGIAMRVGDTSDGVPYILSDMTENAVMWTMARRGLLIIGFALSALMLAGMLGFASIGSFSPYDFARTATLAPGFMLLLMVMLHYNDLVFLKLRAERNWANIQASLKKRKNLLPAWQELVSAYLAHESELQTGLAELRSQYQDVLASESKADAYLAGERRLLDQFSLRAEAYPDLEASSIMSDFIDLVSALENEIALLRHGYNNAVMQYNTRVETFPDLLLAKPFGFMRMHRMAI